MLLIVLKDKNSGEDLYSKSPPLSEGNRPETLKSASLLLFYYKFDRTMIRT